MDGEEAQKKTKPLTFAGTYFEYSYNIKHFTYILKLYNRSNCTCLSYGL